MHGLQGPEERDKVRGEPLKRCDLRCKDCISASFGRGYQEKRSQTWRLQLVAHVRMPRSGDGVVAELIVERGVRVTIDEVKFRELVGVAGRRVDVQTTEITTCQSNGQCRITPQPYGDSPHSR